MILADSSRLRKAALKYARKGIPVFPCKRATKSPYCRGGFHSATTDEEQIREWWEKWPAAMIGVPTGAASGLFVLDIDPDKGGFDSLRSLVEKHGPLPKTTAIRTGGGGLHFYFAHVEGYRCSASEIAPGIDVRAEGGYVIAPPSESLKGRYYVKERTEGELPPPPECILEKLRAQQGRCAATRDEHPTRNGSGAQVLYSVDGPPIHEGRRNITMTSIAGYLHDGTRDLAQLACDLLEINAARCTPVLEAEEVEGIARSIYRLEPCKKGPRRAPPLPEVIGILRDILEDWWRAGWRRTAGKSDRDVLLAYIMFAIELGTILPNGGILVDVSHHQVAERARKSSSTAYNAHKRLAVKGWCRGGGNGPDRREDRPSGIVLLPRPHKERKPEHPQPSRAAMDGVFGFATLPTARRGRHSAPGLVRIASAARIAVIDYLERFDSFTPEAAVADAIGIAREYDLRKRYLEPLEVRGIVERCEEQRVEQRGKRRIKRTLYWWRLTEDWQAALERVFAEEEALERGLYSGLTSDERQRKRREEARERWCNRDNVHPEPAPTVRKLAEYQATRPPLIGAAIRAYQAISDPNTRPGRVYRTSYGADLDTMACAVAAHFGEARGDPQAWRRWIDPVAQALAAIDGETREAVAV